MTENKNIVNFNSEEETIIKTEIHQIFQKILNTSLKKWLISTNYKIIVYILMILGFATAITGGILTGVLSSNHYEKIFFILIFIGVTIIILATLLLFMQQITVRKIKTAFRKENLKFVEMAAKNAFDDVVISNVATTFTIEPQKFLVYSTSMNHKVSIENVLVGTVNNKNFNCGTIIEKIVRTSSTGKTVTTRTTYNRYLYFTCLIENIDYTTTITPETFGSKLMGSNRGDQLESMAFEKKFALDYTDPIKLRKLLVPKVMEKMLELAEKQKLLPKIYLNKNQVTLMYAYMNIASPNQNVGNLVNLVVASNESNLLTNTINMLNDTLNIFASCYEWISSLDLNEKLVFKNK